LKPQNFAVDSWVGKYFWVGLGIGLTTTKYLSDRQRIRKAARLESQAGAA